MHGSNCIKLEDRHSELSNASIDLSARVRKSLCRFLILNACRRLWRPLCLRLWQWRFLMAARSVSPPPHSQSLQPERWMCFFLRALSTYNKVWWMWGSVNEWTNAAYSKDQMGHGEAFRGDFRSQRRNVAHSWLKCLMSGLMTGERILFLSFFHTDSPLTRRRRTSPRRCPRRPRFRSPRWRRPRCSERGPGRPPAGRSCDPRPFLCTANTRAVISTSRRLFLRNRTSIPQSNPANNRAFHSVPIMWIEAFIWKMPRLNNFVRYIRVYPDCPHANGRAVPLLSVVGVSQSHGTFT